MACHDKGFPAPKAAGLHGIEVFAAVPGTQDNLLRFARHGQRQADTRVAGHRAKRVPVGRVL